MIRLKLLLATVAVVLMATAAERPAHSSDPCLLTGLCRPCNAAGTLKQPCKFNPCTGEYICGSCTTHCVLPP